MIQFMHIALMSTVNVTCLLHYSALPPDGLSVGITPVTANISWIPLLENAPMLPPVEYRPLRYLVEVSSSTSAVLFCTTVDHPTNTVEAPKLPACENLTVSVTAEYQFFDGTSASEDFMTVEPGWQQNLADSYVYMLLTKVIAQLSMGMIAM